MRLLIGFLTGLVTAYVIGFGVDRLERGRGSDAYARYRRGEITRAEWSATLDQDWPPEPTIDPDAFEEVAGSHWFGGYRGRPGYRDSVAGGS